MHRLDETQIEEFIERGYLLLRDCLPPEARTLADDTLIRQDPPPTYRGRSGGQSALEVRDLDLTDATTWGSSRLDVETQRSLPIATFAPKLWGAVTSLIGGSEQIRRREMGQQFILNADFLPRPGPADAPKTWLDGGYWHIDAPDQRTSLRGRRDALVLLILWSDVEPDSGGPLFSPGSLERVARQLEATPKGVDTLAKDWGVQHARNTEVFEFNGKVGDVLITHALALHSAQKNHSDEIRVLENPTIMVASALDYSADNPDPTPVEACIIRRLASRAAPRVPRVGIDEGASVLRQHHPDYFLPGRTRWNARLDEPTRAAVHELDRALAREWTRQLATRIVDGNSGAYYHLAAAVAAIRAVFVNELSCDARPAEGLADVDFSSTAWARLGRGFVNGEGQNYALACLVEELFEGAELLTLEGDPRHLVVRAATPEGWALLDAWSSHGVFFVDGLGEGALAGVPELATLQPDRSTTRAGFGRRAYLDARVLPWQLPGAAASLDELVAAVRDAGDGGQVADGGQAEDPWPAFLDARLLQLSGDQEAAGEAYQELLAKLDRRGVTARVAAELGRRTTLGRSALDR